MFSKSSSGTGHEKRYTWRSLRKLEQQLAEESERTDGKTHSKHTHWTVGRLSYEAVVNWKSKQILQKHSSSRIQTLVE